MFVLLCLCLLVVNLIGFATTLWVDLGVGVCLGVLCLFWIQGLCCVWVCLFVLGLGCVVFVICDV